MQSNANCDFKETEIGLFPKRWGIVRLREVVEKMKSGGTPLRSQKSYYGGEIPFVLIEDMTSCDLYLAKTKEMITQEGIKNSSAWLVPPNSLLLSMYATIGETAINTIPVATNQAILAIIPKKNFDPVFGAYLLKYNAENLISQNIQSTQKNINKGIVENFKIPLPPLSEQQRIAYVLRTVQEAKEKSGAVVSALRELKKSMMAHLFKYGPVSLEDARKIRLKETEIGEMPEEWGVVKLGDILSETQYGLSLRGNSSGRYPILRMNSLSDGGLDISDLQYVDLDDKTFEKFRLNKSDILFNRTNSFELVGKTSLFDVDGDYVFASYLIRAAVNKRKAVPEYINYYMNQDNTQIRLKMLATRGVSQSNINATKLRGFCVPLPSIPAQKNITAKVSAMDNKLRVEENKKTALEELFKSLLRDLMSARIRVNNLKTDVFENG
ncbi:MAG: restriction endonuclease subunit S [Candidatus Altiarchaeota archaeon]|nr:restriction endonuclease subunit S [Candidatus Altiarchaeota archaeon]